MDISLTSNFIELVSTLGQEHDDSPNAEDPVEVSNEGNPDDNCDDLWKEITRSFFSARATCGSRADCLQILRSKQLEALEEISTVLSSEQTTDLPLVVSDY